MQYREIVLLYSTTGPCILTIFHCIYNFLLKIIDVPQLIQCLHENHSGGFSLFLRSQYLLTADEQFCS